MTKKIKVLIADDNIYFSNLLSDYLKKVEFIDILGIANTDLQEIMLIDKLKPDIVITDIIRNNRYSGLEIIEKYKTKEDSPRFLVISAYLRDSIIIKNMDNHFIDGYINKVSLDFNKIVYELKKISEI